MQAEAFPLLDSVPGAGPYILAGAVAAALVVVSKLSKRSSLDAIPTVGPSSWLESRWNFRKPERSPRDLIQRGYQMYKTAPFKVASDYHWMVVLGHRQHMEEVRKAPEDVLSFSEAIDNMGTGKYASGLDITISDDDGFDILLSYLTRGFTRLYHETRDEICSAFDEILDLKDHEWKCVPAFTAVQKVVCRTGNRLMVGLPLCRDPRWVALNVQHTLDVKRTERLLGHFPYYLAPFIVRFTNVRENIRQGMKLLDPIIKERLKDLEEHGKDWAGKPKDLLSHWLDTAPEGNERTKILAFRVMNTNMAAVHTSSIAFFNALVFLAKNPEYVQPLREEVESTIEREGWTKDALGKMRMVDSFLKESQRLKGVVPTTLLRKTLKDFTLSDGMCIPKGTLIVAPAQWLHLEDDLYPNAHIFDPFRFSDMCENGEDMKRHFVSTSLEYLPFGHGKHACPGRFLAASMLKTMLARVVLSYDLRLDHNGQDDFLAKIMFRRRVD